MSISFNWFKSKKVQELQDLQIEEQRIKNDLLRKDLFKTDFPDTISVNIVGSEPGVTNIPAILAIYHDIQSLTYAEKPFEVDA